MFVLSVSETFSSIVNEMAQDKRNNVWVLAEDSGTMSQVFTSPSHDRRDGRRAAPSGAAGAGAGAGRRILAVASGGGHWAQLRAVAGNLHGTLVFATTLAPMDLPDAQVYRIPDANASSPIALVRTARALRRILASERPSHVVTTGAAPGAVAVALARWSGIPAIFVDSIANADRLSLSGRLAAALTVPTLTQWAHLAESRARRRVVYAGTVFGERP